jgi:hypothetical protein
LDAFNKDIEQYKYEAMKTWSRHDVFSLINDVVAVSQPDTLVINQGLWRMNRSPATIQRLASVCHKAAPHVIWKTTTRAFYIEGSFDSEAFRSILRQNNFSIFDAYNITAAYPKEAYWDLQHLENHVYTELNTEFLKQFMCSEAAR